MVSLLISGKWFPLTLLICLAAQVQAFQIESDSIYMSLEQVWQSADRQSKEIHIAEKNVAVQQQRVSSYERDRLPDVSITGTIEEATNMPVYGNGLLHSPSAYHEVIHTLYNTQANLYWNIYNGSKQTLKIKAQKLALEIASIDKEQVASNVRYKSTSLFLELQKSVIFREVMKSDIHDQELQLEEIENFYKSGVVLKSDVLRAELELSKRRMALVQINNDISIANQALNSILGLEDEQVIVPRGHFSIHSEETYENAVGTAVHTAFELRKSGKDILIKELAYKKEERNTLPSLGLTGNFTMANPQIFLYPYNPHWYSLGLVGLKLSIPISSFYKNMQNVRLAKLETEKEHEIHHHLEDQMRLKIKEAYLRYDEAKIQIEVNDKNYALALESARIIKDNYFNNTALITDLLDADIQVLKSKFDLEASKIEKENRYYYLQHIKGAL